MGNKTVGKKHNRQATMAKIQDTNFDNFPIFEEDQIGFFETRMDFRESLETWGYFWAHKLIEDAFVRPNFDLSLLSKISQVNNDEIDFSFDHSEEGETDKEDPKEYLNDKINVLKQQLQKKK